MGTIIVENSQTSKYTSILRCDECNSGDIAESIEGYVCRNCGIVLTTQMLRYDIPFKKEAVQYSMEGKSTQLGTHRERRLSPYSWKLYRFNMHRLNLDRKHEPIIKAAKLIPIILEKLKLSRSFAEGIKKKYREIWPQLKHGSKYRNQEKLIPVIIYYCLKLQNVVIRKDLLRTLSGISKIEFNNFQTRVSHFFPEYKVRKRREYISQRLFELTEQFALDMDFYKLSKTILDKFWKIINDTKDDVIAGLCASISVLCRDDDKIKTHRICSYLNIQMSTIQRQVRDKLFKHFKIPGFTTLVGSSNLLRGFLRKIGLLSSDILNHLENNHSNGYKKIKLILGKALRIFNPFKDHYTLDSSNAYRDLVHPYHEIISYLIAYDSTESHKKISEIKDIALLNLFSGKDPPPKFN